MVDGLDGAAESLALHAAEQDAASDPNGNLDSSRYDVLVGGEWALVASGPFCTAQLAREAPLVALGGHCAGRGARELATAPGLRSGAGAQSSVCVL